MKYITGSFSLQMLPPGGSYTLRVRPAAACEVEDATYNYSGWQRRLGHQALADALSALGGHGMQYYADRTPVTLAEGDELLVMQVLGRLPEGHVITEARDLPPITWLYVYVQPPPKPNIFEGRQCYRCRHQHIQNSGLCGCCGADNAPSE